MPLQILDNDPTARSGADQPRDGKVDTSLDADARRLQRTLSDLVRVVQFRDRDRICCHDVTVSQCWALHALATHGPSRLNELAAHLYLDKSTTSRVVDGLVAKDYVERTQDPEDRRAIRIVPTPAGRALLAAIDADLVAESRAVLAGLDAPTRDAVVRTLGRLVDLHTDRVEVDAGCCRWRAADA